MTSENRRKGASLTRRGLLLLALAGTGAGAAELVIRNMGGGHVNPFKPASLTPSQVLDLRNWKINLPVGNRQVNQHQLAGFSDPAFKVVPTVQFTARCGDDPQPGSKYARSELREMNADGSNAAWDPAVGTHVMDLTQRVTHLPDVKPQLVCGQIHNATDYLILIELDRRRLYVRYKDGEIGELDGNYQLGTFFDMKVAVNAGYVDVFYNGVRKAHQAMTDPDCYFKAGCYVQSNTSSGDEPTAFGQVEISRLVITHDQS